MKTLVLGYGVRGRLYAAYALAHPDEYELVGVADPAADFTGGEPFRTFRDWREALAAGTGAEAAIIALPDALHCDAGSAALARGLHIMLEKPLCRTREEGERLAAAERASGRLVMSGYVLRHSPYYRELARILKSGAIGEVVSLHHLCAVSYAKAAHAFCRGNWGREADGATMLVQKCSHDFDLIGWWTGYRKCLRVASFGSLVHWRSENAPAGAAERCADCPAAVRVGCPFDARKLYEESDSLRYHFADRSDVAMAKVVRETPYGRCVYHAGNDAVDHQSVIMEFEGGVTATIEMESFSARRARVTHFYGSRGEIAADGETIEVMPFGRAPYAIRPETHGAHGGGDDGLMADFARLARTVTPSRAASILAGDLATLDLAFRAEESRRGEISNIPGSVDPGVSR